MRIAFKPMFIRKFKKLLPELQDEVREKIALFKDPMNHERLKVHKLKGRLSDYYSFSVNYQYRIVFAWHDDTTAVLLDIGNHSVYR